MEGIIITVGITMGALLLVAYIMQKSINARGGCPDCGTPVPMFRSPTSWRQGLWGGWTCEACGLEMDRSGRGLTRK